MRRVPCVLALFLVVCGGCLRLVDFEDKNKPTCVLVEATSTVPRHCDCDPAVTDATLEKCPKDFPCCYTFNGDKGNGPTVTQCSCTDFGLSTGSCGSIAGSNNGLVVSDCPR